MKKVVFIIGLLLTATVYSFSSSNTNNASLACVAQAIEYTNWEEGLLGFENDQESWDAYHEWYSLCIGLN